MLNEGNQIHNFMSSSGSGTVIDYGSGSDFLTGYGYGSGSGSTSQKVTVPSYGSGSGSTTLVRTMTDSKSDAAGEEDEKEMEGNMGAPRTRLGCGLMVLLVPESMAASASLLVLYLRMTEGVASSSMMSVISPNFCKRSNS